MSIFGDNYLRTFRLNLIFHTIGLAFLNVRSFAAIMKEFVYGGKEDEASFVATCKNLTFFHPELMSVTTEQTFRDLHDFTIECGKPLATIFCSEMENCRACGKMLDGHPVVIYHSQRGTYLGSRLTKIL